MVNVEFVLLLNCLLRIVYMLCITYLTMYFKDPRFLFGLLFLRFLGTRIELTDSNSNDDEEDNNG